LVRSYALAKGHWQTLDHPDWVKADQRFENHALAGFDFDPELRDALAEYWRGALAQHR
jgi:hypothetical protein